MNISSRPEQADPTPDPREIIRSIRTLKREVSRIGESSPGAEYSRLERRIDALEESVRHHISQLDQFERALMTAASTRLTGKQRTILGWLVTHSERPVYTVLIQQLSDELAIPESTVRWNLKGLREAELIRAGSKDNKGVPVSLTAMGRFMAGCAPAPMD